jgi:maleamate amidohydrolase
MKQAPGRAINPTSPMPWDSYVSETDRTIFEQAGWGKSAGFGSRPVLVVIDVNYNFVGIPRLPVLESIKDWKFSCGERGWQGVDALVPVIAKCRDIRLPIIYTTNPKRHDGFDLGVWNLKQHRANENTDVEGHRGNEIVDEVAPQPGDIFIEKKKPSAFYGTPLTSYLIELKADTLILVGTTTSGCVRASAVDAVSDNFRVVIPHECAWDRSEISHAVNLMDLNMKYCDVTDVADVMAFLDTVPAGLFDEQFPR